MAEVTSSFETGPMDTYETGISFFFKNSNNASKEPKVEQATPKQINEIF